MRRLLLKIKKSTKYVIKPYASIENDSTCRQDPFSELPKKTKIKSIKLYFMQNKQLQTGGFMQKSIELHIWLRR